MSTACSVIHKLFGSFPPFLFHNLYRHFVVLHKKNKICFGKDFRGNYLNQAAPGPSVACWFGPADLVQVVAP